MTDVFVSYSREDQAVARCFAEGFQREGFSVWWDQALNPGEAFDQVTERALEEAKAVVVLWSQRSVNSRWVRAEATQANANNRLLPVMIEACRRPIMFELTHTADLAGWDGDEDDPAWQALVAGVRRFVERPSNAASGAPLPATPPVQPSTAKPVVQRSQAAPSRSRKSSASPQRRSVLVYGASALGLAAAGFAGGTWLRSGSGAPERPLAYQRLTFRRGLIRSARFAPDGQTILYGALWDGELARIYSTRTDNPESRALELPNANLLAVSRAGDLALALGAHLDGVFTYGTLARVPIAGGAPRELAEEVKFADWSPDGSELAIIRRVDGNDQLEYPPGKVLFKPKEGEGTGLTFLRFAPDGRLAFIHCRAWQSLVGRVCVIDSAGRVETLTDEYVNIHGLAWRGNQIWYSASDDRPLFRSLLMVEPGSKPRVVTRMPVNLTLWDAAPDGRLLIAQTDDRAAMIARLPGEASDRDLSWLDASWVADMSRDGQKVLFSETGQGVGSIPAAYLRGTDGSPAVRLGSGLPLALSPDLKSALIAEADVVLGSGTTLDIVPTGAGETRRIAQGMSYLAARWLPDGQQIVLQAAEQGRPRLYRIRLPDGEPEALTEEGVGTWAVSPSGSDVAAAMGGAIQVMSLAGGPVRAMSGTTGREEIVAWIEEGLLLFRRGDPDSPRGEVYLLDPSTGRQRSWGNIHPQDGSGVMLMARFAITPDGRARVFTWHRALSNLYIATGVAP